MIEITPEYLAAQGLSDSFPYRFWSKVQKTETCWFWTGAKSHGYGSIGARKARTIRAHVASWLIHFGPIPKGFEVCHSCDVNYLPGDNTYRLCVRPDHIHLATHVENIREMVDKGRTANGELATSHKLTTEQVIEIRQLYSKHSHKYNQTSLGREFGVDQSTIHSIITRHTWKYI